MCRHLTAIAVVIVAQLVAASGAGAEALTPSSASAAFKTKILREAPEARFPSREGALCPETFEGSEGLTSSCFAEFTTGATWNLSGAAATSEDGHVVFSFLSSAHWKRRWVRCRLARAPGKLLSNHRCGYGQPETDAYFVWDELVPNIRFHHPLRSIGWQFTDSAGFTSLGIYRGAKNGRSYRFTNAVGDSFRYTP